MSHQVQIVVIGKVQGVYFRETTKRKARSLDLKGTVKNLPDGSVEIFAQGTLESLALLKKWCWEGSPYSRVDEVVFSEFVDDKNFTEFQIIY